MEDAKLNSLALVEGFRYDSGRGYFWINDLGKPPKMIMHPLNKSLDGKLLDAAAYNCVGASRENLFSAGVEICEKSGDGFIEYVWPKDPSDPSKGMAAKLSYVRLFKPYGWVSAPAS
jgi:methyl-accepting chemotaxis protein